MISHRYIFNDEVDIDEKSNSKDLGIRADLVFVSCSHQFNSSLYSIFDLLFHSPLYHISKYGENEGTINAHCG